MAKGQVLSSAAVIKLIGRDGWALVRITGSHHIFRHRLKPGIVVVPHPRKALKRGTQRSILKQAGLL
jgi:predicted RNA binding protein YcfA (HicA-like mRNA interferase family)